MNISADSFKYNSFNNHGVIGLINMPTARFYDESSYGFTFYNGNPDQKITMTSFPFDWLEASFFYTSINDNPTFELTDIERSTDPERLIEVKILDSDITNDINEARTVSKIKVNLTSQNDDPVILVNDFNRVQLLPVEEDGSTQLKAQSTFLLPISLDDQPEIDALGASLYGESSSGLIFDPDSMISQITIEITSPDLSTLDVARNQDKLIFEPSYENGFVLEGEEGTSILSLTLSSDIIESQTNADNQAMVEEALRSIKYENDKAVEAEEKANSTRYIEKAEGMKQVDVISAASKAEQDKYETMAAKLRYEIDAAGKEALNMAENVRSDASRRSALRNKLAEKIESIIRESVKPMANIGDIKIIDVNGLPGFSGTSGGGSAAGGGKGKDGAGGGSSGNLADNVVSSALRYRAHQPFLDSLLKEIGMNPGEISNIRNILGDYGNPKKDYHMNFGENVASDLKGDKSPKK